MSKAYSDVVRASSELRGQNAGGVGVEDVVDGSGHVVVVSASHVVVDRLPLLERSQVTAELLGVGVDAARLADRLHLVGTALDVALLHAAGGGGVGALCEGASTVAGGGVPDIDLAADVLVAVVLAGVGGGKAGREGEAGGQLDERNHLRMGK